MVDPNASPGIESPRSEIPEAEIIPRRRFSIVWLLPFLAALIAGWLTYRAVSDRGPAITIAFRTAEDLEAGKTKVKYRELEVGVVESIELVDDLTGVLVTARMTRDSERFLTDGTRFWVVRANITGGRITGLGTLLSGAYIGMDPSEGGKPAWSFTGLETAPLVTSRDPGRRFVLRAAEQGSLQPGSPIYYRKVRVGEVIRTELDESGDFVNIDIFVHAPQDQYVLTNTRFRNVSGIEVSVSAEGLRVDTESVAAMLIGGAAFDTPDFAPGERAAEGTVFYLSSNRREISDAVYTIKQRYVLHFTGSVKGLSAGAPVEFRGIRIGQVVDVSLNYNRDEKDFRIPVVIEIEPERFSVEGENPVEIAGRLAGLVERGLRAQLKTTNLLTGQLVVDFDIQPNAPRAVVKTDGLYPELPTVPTPLEELSSSLTRLVGRLERLPTDEIGADLQASLKSLRATLDETRELARQMNQEVAPAAARAMGETEKTLASVHALINPDSTVSRELKRLLVELADAARSIRVLADHLERNPEDLIRGRQGEP